ncbi:hypothetical protein NP233_g5440 [Leucocoprinus birnbaumii]|uniref:Laccase n=1 Tax=Leucocoprinus birnbaumii TaxID=56174 RepID=A0AAD5VSU8_9AGAR|nr:hypothetical protein NP233_g5440 [Leucocoprinus birnbaumii]
MDETQNEVPIGAHVDNHPESAVREMKQFLLLQSFVTVALASIGPVTELQIVNRIVAPDGFNRSAPSLQETRFYIEFSGSRSRLELSGIIVTTPLNTAMAFGEHSLSVTRTTRKLLLYDVDTDDTVITLSDWYHVVSPQAGLVPTEDATLINGLGRYIDGPNSPLAVISVESGKRYRMRLVSISCDPNFVFSIDSHLMTIIEVESTNVDPLEVDSIQIYAGQRYSFVLNANQPVDNYWIRALPNAGPSGFSNGVNSAILRYTGATDADPTTNQTTSTNPLVETNLHPLTDPGAPGTPEIGAADVNLNLAITFNGSDFLVNGASWTTPTAPVLLQIMSGARTASELLPSGSVYTLPANSVIELSVPGGTIGAPHPFHLHGDHQHTFDVIRSAGNSSTNFINPVRRDVVNTGGASSDNVTIRFTTNNPGPWIFHCHIDWHLREGLAIVFAEDADVVATETVPTAWSDLCPIYDALPPDEL